MDFINTFCPITFLLLIRRCFPEEEQSQQEHNGKTSHTSVDLSGNLADERNQEGSEECGAFSADVQNSEVFAGFFGGNDLGKIRTGQSLDRSLEHTDQDCEDPELGLGIQSDRVKGDTEVCYDTDTDQSCRIIPCGDSSEQECARESHDLGQKQCQKQSGTVESECLSVSGCHIDDGIDSVDIEEKGNQEEQYLFLPADFPEGMSKAFEAVTDHMSACGFCIIFLFINFQHRQGRDQPPKCSDDKSDHHSGRSGKPKGTCA